MKSALFLVFLWLTLTSRAVSMNAEENELSVIYFAANTTANPVTLSCEGIYYEPNADPIPSLDFIMKIYSDHIQLIGSPRFPTTLKISNRNENRILFGVFGLDPYTGSINRFTGKFTLQEHNENRWIRMIQGSCQEGTQKF